MKRFITARETKIHEASASFSAPIKGVIYEGFEIRVEDGPIDGEAKDGESTWYRAGSDYFWGGDLLEASIPPVPVAATPANSNATLGPDAQLSPKFIHWCNNILFRSDRPDWLNRSGEGIRIAVLDDGILPSHPALRQAIERGERKDFTGEGLESGCLHGTRCAGIIAAQSNSPDGVIGIAPEATIVDAKVLGTGGGPQAIKAAVEWYTDSARRVDIFSMSFDMFGEDGEIASLIQKKSEEGFIFIAAAGDAILDLYGDGTDPLVDTVSFPASLDACISVGIISSIVKEHITRSDDVQFNRALNYLARDLPIFTTDVEGKYSEEVAGSSFAAPFAAGLAALILEEFEPGGNRSEFVREKFDEIAVDLNEMLFDESSYQPLVIPK